ncbi:hypothetical protein H8B06_13365 [Sphingobacterium sp. DN00404]|uniref:Uncharacterized protein n=1 Tax=Sphingobacterium micropteri TaxID=2763501 RepID=A0ABR7YR46_9SPHI|nr:hypothetical protein [Sphingobacterium micropteri]MBD1433820.1 hypothetical protein [Sphingobacterium micropteri]
MYRKAHYGSSCLPYPTEEGPLEVYEYLPVERSSYTDSFENRPVWVYLLNGEVVEWDPGKDWQIDKALTKRMLERFREHKKQTLN